MRFEYTDGRMPAAMTTYDGSIYYLACDQVGSLRTVTDISGTVVRRIRYDSFGNIISPPDSSALPEIPFGFAGGLHDRDTGLVRFGRRDYDPDMGRWTAKDPIRFAGGDTDLYGYCLNNPINHIDPRGEAFLIAITVIAGIVYLYNYKEINTIVPDIINPPPCPSDPDKYDPDKNPGTRSSQQNKEIVEAIKAMDNKSEPE